MKLSVFTSTKPNSSKQSKMKLGIVGSRRRDSQKDLRILYKRVQALKPDELVSGGCPKGADKFAEHLAKQLGIPIKIFYPKLGGCFSYYGRVKAYHDRNEQIAKYSDRLIALVASDRKGGTENTIKYFIKHHGKKNLEIL